MLKSAWSWRRIAALDIVAPAANSTVHGAVSLVAEGEGIGRGSLVQFYIDGEELGAAIAQSPYSLTLNTLEFANGSHTIYAVARRYGRQIATTESIRLNIQNQTVPVDSQPPDIIITAPTQGSDVEGVVQISATATDNVGVTAVRFLVNGSQVGEEKTASPFNVQWDVSSLIDGSTHSLQAIALDAAGNTRTSLAVTVVVNTPEAVGTIPTMTSVEINPCYQRRECLLH